MAIPRCGRTVPLEPSRRTKSRRPPRSGKVTVPARRSAASTSGTGDRPVLGAEGVERWRDQPDPVRVDPGGGVRAPGEDRRLGVFEVPTQERPPLIGRLVRGVASGVAAPDHACAVVAQPELSGGQLVEDPQVERRSVRDDLDRDAPGCERPAEEPARCGQVTLAGQPHVDDLPMLVDRPVQVCPPSGDPDVGLVDEPPITKNTAPTAARPRRTQQ
jgi:hypothetical protein